VRLIAPAFTVGVSDGQLNGTDRMRYSLTSRELVNDSTEAHLKANDMSGVITVVACDKPPVGTLAALLEHNAPALMLSDGSIHPGIDPVTGGPIDLVHRVPVRGGSRSRGARPPRAARVPRSGQLRRHVHLQHHADVHRRAGHGAAAHGGAGVRRHAPHEDLPRRARCAARQPHRAGIRPRDIVTPASMRNAFVVVMAMGGSTNVVLHGPEIARAAGFDLWDDVMSQQEFNELSHRLPVLVNMRPFGAYSMVDVDAIGGVTVIVRSSSPPASWTVGPHLHRARRWQSRSRVSTRGPTARSCLP
jgi:dihydroxy-acid dehydratase